MRIPAGIVVGLLVWAVLFLVLPQEFLGTVVGRPFELDDGTIIIRYPWGMLLMVVGFFVIPGLVAKVFSEMGEKK